MKLIFVLITTLFTGFFFYAQEVLVLDSITGNALEKVQIASPKNNRINETNYLGKALLQKSSSDSVWFSLDNYTPKAIRFSDLSADTINIIALKNEVFKLNPLVITGNNWKLNKIKSAAHITTFNDREIQFESQPNTADVVGASPEVYIQKSQLGGGSPMMRGFATNRLLIVVDGVNMNNAIFRSGNIQNIIAIDPNSLSKLDIAPGPGSVLFGSDAIGGVLSFDTQSILPSSQKELNGLAAITYGNAAEMKNLHSSFQFSSKKWAGYTGITYSQFGDLKMGTNGPNDYLRTYYIIRENGEDVMMLNDDPYLQRNSGYIQRNLLQKIGFFPHEKLTLNASITYSETSAVPRYDRLLQYRGENLRSAEWSYGPQQWILSRLSAEYSKPTLFFDEVQSIIAHQYFTESRHDRDFNSDIRTNRYERVNVYSWDNNFIKKLTNENQVLYGFDVRLNHINSTGNNENINDGSAIPAASRYPDGSTWNQFGVYAKLKSEMFDGFNLESGLRYSLVHSTSDFTNSFFDFPFENADFMASSVTGKVGFNYKIRKDFVINSNFSTGFRAPNIDDISKVFDSEPGNVVIPNPDLQPEYIYNVDFGVKKSFRNVLMLYALGYYSWLEDALVRREFTLNGESEMIYDGELSQIQAVQNAAQAKVYGGLAQVELNIHKYFKLLGCINYTHGTEELDDGSTAPLRHAAPVFGNTALMFEKNKLKLRLNYEFQGEISADNMPPSEIAKAYLYAKDDNGLPYVPAWQILNFNSQLQLNNHITLNFSIENIFDKLYRPYSSGISAAGRNFVISLRTIF